MTWEEDDGDRVMGSFALAMTDDLSLVITCPIGSCPWAGLMPTQWSPLPEIRSLLEFLNGHVSAKHPEVLKLEDGLNVESPLYDVGKHVAGQIGMMRARMIAIRDRTCFAVELVQGNEASDGVMAYALRQQAIERDECEQFDAWWSDAKKHARTHEKPQTNVSRWLMGLLGKEEAEEIPRPPEEEL